ncbi:unnamed protein product [Candidula unifasciata]|uniref:Uncharacterized protein n=1 Tax=Candidula unifasciata TaxID=100452 RepID=A0A8S3ZSN5_9EUPU|nr:unnamed protein product [Candidula unifasciata]
MANSARGRGNPENAEDEDDFNDFGGFEAAEPAGDIAASHAQAAASPWALFNAGNVPGRPDLLCAQNRFPTYLDPSDISGASTEAMNVNLSYPAGNRPVQPQADLFDVQFPENQGLLDQARIAENVLDGTLDGATGAGFIPAHSVANGRLPDIGLGINENRLFNQAEELNLPEALIAENPPLLELPLEGVPLVNWANAEPQEAASREEHNILEPQRNVENMAEENAVEEQPAESALSEASRVTEAALQERLNLVTERNHALEEELERVKGDLAAQRSRLQDIHTRHTEEMEEVRKAGHDALTVVVEQYKEQSRAVVLEEKEVAQRHLLETLDAQMTAFKDMLRLQQELHEQQKEDDRRELGLRIDRAVEESRQQQQEQFDVFLARERAAQVEAQEKSLEAERTATQERFQKAVAEQQEKTEARLRELEGAYSQKLEEERQSHELALKAVREEEKRLAQEQITLMVSEERERGRAAIRSALDSSMVDVRSYIEEQRQADSRVRRRHLASLDVFLESSRQQIRLLLESEKPESTSSTAPPPPRPPSNGSGET